MIITILKIVGIVLLVILGILFLILSVVLFVPIRYKVSGNKDAKERPGIEGMISASWLMHIVSAYYEYKDKNTSFVIRIFGIQLRSAEERAERKNRKKTALTSDKAASCSMLEYDDKSGTVKEHTINANGKTHVFIDEHEDTSDISEPIREKENDTSYTQYRDEVHDDTVSDIKKKLEKIAGRVSRIKNRLTGINENIAYYYNALVNDSCNKDVLNLLIKKVKQLLKAIAPRKVKGCVEYGCTDPSNTGRFLAAAAMLYPLYGRSITVIPDFENDVISFELMLKGRIYVFTLIRILLQLYFNKKVKRFIHIMKKENANG